MIRNTMSRAIDEDGNELGLFQMINADGALVNGQMRFDYDNVDVLERFVDSPTCKSCGEETVCRREVLRTNDRYFANGIVYDIPVLRQTRFEHSCGCGVRFAIGFQSWD